MVPALGPLPWLVMGLGGTAHIVAHVHEHAGHLHHDGHDRSDVPGSPTHPADHGCLACQVLAQLGRCCALPTPLALQPPAAASYTVARFAESHAPPSSSAGLMPPARAPPQLPV